MTETNPTKRERMYSLWQQALAELSAAQETEETFPRPLAQAALFYCFQHAMFLAFKTLKACLKEEGLSPLTPKQHLEMARQAGWIEPEAEDDWWVLLMSWLQLPEIYEPEQAAETEDSLRKTVRRLYELADRLKPAAGNHGGV